MDHDEVATRVLDAAEALFYERGTHAVGMDAIRAASAVPLKAIYQRFPGKHQLIAAYLLRRDLRWRAALAAFVDRRDDPTERLLAVFDWLHGWFSEPDFRGCAFINAFGELGATTPEVAAIAQRHKDALRHYLVGLAAHLPDPAAVAEHLLLLIDGATVSAALSGDPDAARHARAAAATLVERRAPTTATGGRRTGRRRSPWDREPA